MHGKNVFVQRAGKGLAVLGVMLAVAACGYVPRGNDTVDQSWYIGQCAPHKPDLASGAEPRGSEDMTMDAKGVLYVSSNDYRFHLNTVPRKAGAIYRYDVAGEGKVTPMAIRSESNRLPAYFDKNFFPHGISLLEGPKEKRLFVINHRLRALPRPADKENLANLLNIPAGEVRQSFVEIFRVEKSGDTEILVHEKTVEDKAALTTGAEPRGGRGFILNDLVAVGPRQFFATNNPSGFTQEAEKAFLRNPISNIVYFDGTTYHLVKDRVGLGNGINVTADNSVLYLATMRDGEIVAFRTNLNPPGETQPSEVTLEEMAPRLRIGGHLDNIEWVDSKKREMLVASHANLVEVGLQLVTVPVKAPSRIVRFAVNADGSLAAGSAKLIYENDGKQVSAATVATFFQDKSRERLIIGSLLDESFLVCKLDAH